MPKSPRSLLPRTLSLLALLSSLTACATAPMGSLAPNEPHLAASQPVQTPAPDILAKVCLVFKPIYYDKNGDTELTIIAVREYDGARVALCGPVPPTP